MKKIETPLDGAFIIEPQVFGDVRGWFYESYSKQKMHDIGIDVEFVQDNRSFSAQQGTLRGLHCQTPPMAQTKLLTCLRGRIMDVAVDIRRGSPTYMQWTAVELSGENKKMFFIPKGFGTSIALTGGAEAALWSFMAFYVTCLVITWAVYARRGGLLHDVERQRRSAAVPATR